jgi:hypothetical protein
MKAHSSDLTQLHAFSPSVTRFSSASNDSDSGNRGKTFNVYRTGRLCRTRQFEIRGTIQAYKIETTTYKAIPVSTYLLATFVPRAFHPQGPEHHGHIDEQRVVSHVFTDAGPSPKTVRACPLSCVSAGPGINLSCSSRNLSGLKLAASSP